MPGTYGMRAVPLGPSCDLVVAGKAGMDGLWSAIPVYWNMAGKYWGLWVLPTFIHSWVWATVRGPGGVLGVFLPRVSRVRPGLSGGLCGWEWGGKGLILTRFS